MKLTPVEMFITEVLECGVEDIRLLDEVYSPLAEEVMMDDGWVLGTLMMGGHRGINSILKELYNNVRWSIIDRLEEMCNENNTVRDIVKKNVSNIENYPYLNCLDSKFDSDIDQIINWEGTVDSNTDALIAYWKKQEDK